MEAQVQMNTRIGRELKKRGDDALAQIGYSPSQAVRALWEKAAQRGESLQKVADLLSSDESANSEANIDALEQGWALVDSVQESLGIQSDVSRELPDDELLLERYWSERLLQRGLL